jgi:gas vesicle protein
MLIGAVIGGALVYFLDPQNGAGRRQRVMDWWEQNREPVINSATSAASSVQARATETTAKVNEKVSELGARVRGDSSPVSVT